MASANIYNHQEIESKWQELWEKEALFQNSAKAGENVDAADKMYLLFAFAYPSGSGLHVGHVESKTALDIMARYYRMHGKDVFFPVGWDAFGLPAENYAIKTGVPPATTTKDAINTFRRQIKRLGISYDWGNELATNHPGYYKWTQWLFLQMYKKGLAYQGMGMVNWCPSCQTVLANEQVVNGECERCGTKVVQKDLKQWYFKITQYQDELISGLDEVDWPEATKQQQLNWIGKSEGAKVAFKVVVSGKESQEALEVFTTAHDTIYGCTFMVVAPEHQLLKKYQKQITNWSQVESYLEEAKKKTELDRQIQKEKTGVKVEGIELINPVNGEKVPLFVADYVLGGYGTGAIMAVPGHDERDYEFAQKYELPVLYVTGGEAFVSYGEIKQNRSAFKLKNSAEFNGQDFVEGRAGILAKLATGGQGHAQNQYKLRDWLISRQRYWGAPIPVVYDPEGNAHPVKEEHLPWTLPTDVEFKPTGESPLTHSKEFIERTEKLYGKGWRPEYDTMDTFVDSSWYFLRYVDSRNEAAFADKEQLKKWLPVDLYMIGPEHIVLHLLYSRFFTKFLRDEGYFKFNEPFMKMRHQGMILGPDGKKMSKSKGNVINPDEVIEKFGADTLRVYEMFMGPLEADKPWDVRAVAGVYRFLRRIFDLVKKADQAPGPKEGSDQVRRKLHQTIKKVTEDIPKLKFNTSIATMMEFVNEWEKGGALEVADLDAFIKILAPFAPFLADELYANLKTRNPKSRSVHVENWPSWDEALVKVESIMIPVQINGKVRDQVEISTDQVKDQAVVITAAKQLEKIQPWLAGKQVVKEIYVSGKILNLVVK
jgi:leucyl-tRNA synthetase